MRQNISINHALINLTENIQQAVGEGYIGCEIFIHLQKASDTIDHETILARLNIIFGVCQITRLNLTSLVANILFQ